MAMGSNTASPDRPPVKVTYTSRKRKTADKEKSAEESEASASEVEPHKAAVGTARVNMSPNSSKSASGVRVASLDLPGPEPRVKRVGSKKELKEKGSSPDTLRTPGKAAKPASTLGSKIAHASTKRFETPDSDGMPAPPASDVSDREGSSSRAARTTEAERRAYFESHPDVAELEPHRVRCRCCNKWLKLNAAQNYALAPWKLHKKSCTAEKPCTRKPRQSTDLDGMPAESGADDDDASSVAPSVSASEATVAGRQRSSAERQRILEEDDLSGEVRADAVYCSACSKWVRLSNRSPYQLKNWGTHVGRVHGRKEEYSTAGAGAPSNRVQEAERKLQLVNDAQAREFSASRVTCGICSADIMLSETKAYQLDNWLAHKADCHITSPSTEPSSTTAGTAPAKDIAATSPPANLDVQSPTGRAPPSTASTDKTYVAADAASGASSSSGAATVGQKRPREEDDETEQGGSEAVRARTSSYLPPDMTPSGPWGWLKLPWETFKKGFAESLGKPEGEDKR